MTKRCIWFLIAIFCLFIILSCIFVFCEHKDKNKIVNIVFTTDVNYKDYLKTTIRSAIANKNKDSVYNINIVCVDLPKSEEDKFKKFESKNVHINPVSVSLQDIKDVGNYEVSYFVTRADLFKFFMPELFPKLDKILYIDVDVAIMKDLTDLYNTDLKDKFIGVVNKPIMEYSADGYTIFGKYFPKRERHYNCGVMLFNLKLWRENDITQALVNEKNEKKETDLMTQYVFNAVLPQSKIKALAPINNVFTQWDDVMFKKYQFWFTYFPYCITGVKCNFDNLIKDAVIIHYLDAQKPWKFRKNHTSKYWLKYEKQEDYE